MSFDGAGRLRQIATMKTIDEHLAEIQAELSRQPLKASSKNGTPERVNRWNDPEVLMPLSKSSFAKVRRKPVPAVIKPPRRKTGHGKAA